VRAEFDKIVLLAQDRNVWKQLVTNIVDKQYEFLIEKETKSSSKIKDSVSV